MSTKTTPEGAPAAPAEQPRNPRDNMIDSMADRLHEQRATLADDDSEQFGTPDSSGVRPEDRDDEQHAAAPAPAAPAPEPVGEDLTDEEEAAAMATASGSKVIDWLVQDDEGNAFMVAKVDGEEKLIPLDKVRATMQKHEAADARLQHASEAMRDLEAREAAVREAERRIQERTAYAVAQNPAPLPAQGEDDQEALLKEAKSIISDLFDGNEDDAASKLAKAIAAGRVSHGTSMSAEEIARQAAEAAAAQLEAREEQRELQVAWKAFQKDYPDLIADKALFAAVDAQTDVVHAEHPDWTPTEVMAEAGRQIRERFNLTAPSPAGNQQGSPKPTDRLENKRKLRPMPLVAQDTRKPPEPEKPPTAADILAETRRARGQAV